MLTHDHTHICSPFCVCTHSALKGSHSYTLTSHTYIHPHNAHRYPHTHSPSHVLAHPLTPTGLQLHVQPSTQPTPGPQPHTENFFAVLPSPELSLPCLAQLVLSSCGGVAVGDAVRAEATAQGSLKLAALLALQCRVPLLLIAGGSPAARVPESRSPPCG